MMLDDELWFALDLLFLHYKSHHGTRTKIGGDSCDLLWIYYFCTINHTCQDFTPSESSCCDLLWIYYFCTINHTTNQTQLSYAELWFALDLLFLHYKSHRTERRNHLLPRCDLLWIYYFCTINHTLCVAGVMQRLVVICFGFIIFAL